jgi:hypothetical protein
VEITADAAVVGEGRRLSILRWTAPNGGLKFDGGAVGGRFKRTFSMSSIGLVTTVPNGGRAVEATSTIGVGNIGKTLDIRDCDFYQHSDNAYWDYGVWLDDIRDASFLNCDFRGREGELPGGFGIRIGGERSPTTHAIGNCLFAGLDTAVAIEGTVEGVVVHKCVTVGKRGVVWNTTQRRPLLVVGDSHFDVQQDGVFINNGNGVFIHDSTFYPRTSNVGPRAGVVITGNSKDARITHCVFARGNPDADDFNATCVQVSGWTCSELHTAITCKGSNASCRRQEAAAALNAVSGCTE